MVVEPVDDLHPGAAGEPPVGEVGLPTLVGLIGFEPPIGTLGPFLRLSTDQPSRHQDPPDRRGRRHRQLLVGKVPADRLRPVI